MANKAQLHEVLQHPAIWRAADGVRQNECQQQRQNPIATGHKGLDKHLPDGGLPENSVVEILCPQWGCGEAELLSSALASLSQQSRWLVWVNPPWLPYAPALIQQNIQLNNTLVIQAKTDKDILWAMEQCLKSGACSVVQGWPKNPLPHQIRRLQAAAQNGNSLCLLMRPQSHLQQPSPAPLRLEMGSLQQRIQVRIVKCRGSWGSHWLYLQPTALTNSHQASSDQAIQDQAPQNKAPQNQVSQSQVTGDFEPTQKSQNSLYYGNGLSALANTQPTSPPLYSGG